ncbi:Serine hydroxymethyltransferase, cytosolic, partial [Perkinsus olseni]
QKGVDKKGNAIAYDYAEKINSTVFPGMQGGPHNHIIAGLSVALKQAASVEFREYQEQVVANAAALATEMQKFGFNLVSGGTENHLMLVDLKNKGVNGSKVEKVCELASITLNKNTVPGDKSAMNPSGLRIGSPAMTSRGCTEEDFRRVARFLNRAVDIALEVQKRVGSSKQAAFNKFIEEHDIPEIEELRREMVPHTLRTSPKYKHMMSWLRSNTSEQRSLISRQLHQLVESSILEAGTALERRAAARARLGLPAATGHAGSSLKVLDEAY